MKLSTAKSPQPNRLVALVVLSIIGMSVTQAAPPPLSIKSAAYNKKTSSLVVKTLVNSPSGLLTLLHSKGGVLGQSQENEHTFTIPLTELGEIPCQVEARLGELKISKAVAGAGAECSKVPVCKILKPVSNLKTTINQPTHFEAQYALKDKKAGPLAIEWDFAGGVMGHPYQKPLKGNKPILSGKHKTDATFVRDNSRYHVRFMATDTQGRHCESGIYVDVGTPPTDLPDATALEDMVEASQTNAPAKGSALKIPAGEKVVLPYQDWTMQTATDARTVPNVYVVYGPQVNNINATVYEKARKPPVIGDDKVELKYSAASNPADPVGPNSINSTSQNYPLEASFKEAAIKKSDFFERYVRPAEHTIAEGYYDTNYTGFLTPELASAVDEGYHSNQITPALNPDHGRYMPGKEGPYAANDPQSFSKYVEADNLFAALMLPLTDIDDAGRVNPTPLFRIEARDSDNAQTFAATDIVINSGRDLHCRECHLKGEIGANPEKPKSIRRAINYYEAEGDSIADQEYAAIRNITNLHQVGASCGDNIFLRMENGNASTDLNGNTVAYSDGPSNCNSSTCHTTAISRTPYKQPLRMDSNGGGMSSMGRPLSDDMHRYHGQLQYKDASKKEVVRTDDARVTERAKAFDPEQNWDPKTGSMPNSLFPVKDAKGNILPMEENCLKCHGGMREQCYRDRMYTAGVTCYQCHGDMLAVGNSFKKSTPSADGGTYRQPWIDEPDCASCHTGNANQGKNGNDEFFSGGVRKTAFDQLNDRSATPYQADRFNPDEARFAVPVTDMNIGDIEYTPEGGVLPLTTKTPLFRAGKDNHGAVACGACHGAAHAIWPNRDPNANDNVTALQLQGHSGPIAECSVCHTDDAFAQRDDLDEGLRATNSMEHVLGGPHNMHPINDPNWWKGADADDNANETSDKIKGGWHNDYAKFPGRAGEDQCAACHGNDHLGTRLSKTPVDREFINEKGKTIKVKAGTPISCKLCHTVDKSCTKSPAGKDCGKPSERVAVSTNLAPVINSVSPSQVMFGGEYSYALKATDPEGSKLSYQLIRNNYSPINSSYLNTLTGLFTVPASKIEELTSYYDPAYAEFLFDYQISVRDSQGSTTVEAVKVKLECPDGNIWDTETHSCQKITITSRTPVNGVTGEHEYNYQVLAKQRSGEPLTYSLNGQPEGMTISSTGLIYWMPPANQAEPALFEVIASNDQGDTATQQVFLAVCLAPMHWEETAQSCLGPVSITSTPLIYGITAGESYSYQVTATQLNHLPLTYSLSNAPSGMTIDKKTGLINWITQASTSGPVSFTVNANDKTYTATQDITLTICAAPESWDGSGLCIGPIEFTSTPVWGVDVGQPYSYQVAATHHQDLPLTYSLDFTVGEGAPPKPEGVSIDPKTGLISWLAQAQPAEFGGYAYFSVIATDSHGYSTPQSLVIRVCEAGTNWSEAMGTCRGDVRITSTQPVIGLDLGETFSYQVVATEANTAGLPLTYSLSGLWPETISMSIDAKTGLITWIAEEDPNNRGAQINFTVTATDTLGQQESQTGYLSVCVHPQHWNTEGYCN